MRSGRTILPGLNRPPGSKASLTSSNAAVSRGAEHRLVELAAHDAVAVLAGVRAPVPADHLEAFLRDRPHGARAFGGLQVDDGAHVQGAHRGMRVPGAAGAVAGEDFVEAAGVLGEVFQAHRAVLDERDRLPVALHRHHDVQARLAHLPDRALERRLHRLHHRAGEAQVRHPLAELPKPGEEGAVGPRPRTPPAAGRRDSLARSVRRWGGTPRCRGPGPSGVRSTSSTAVGSRATMCRVAAIASWNAGKWHTPSTRWAGSGWSASSIPVKNPRVPSDPTSRWAMLWPPGMVSASGATVSRPSPGRGGPADRRCASAAAPGVTASRL